MGVSIQCKATQGGGSPCARSRRRSSLPPFVQLISSVNTAIFFLLACTELIQVPRCNSALCCVGYDTSHGPLVTSIVPHRHRLAGLADSISLVRSHMSIARYILITYGLISSAGLGQQVTAVVKGIDETCLRFGRSISGCNGERFGRGPGKPVGASRASDNHGGSTVIDSLVNKEPVEVQKPRVLSCYYQARNK